MGSAPGSGERPSRGKLLSFSIVSPEIRNLRYVMRPKANQLQKSQKTSNACAHRIYTYAIMSKNYCLLSVDVWHFWIKLCGGEIGKSPGAQESYWKMFCQQVQANANLLSTGKSYLVPQRSIDAWLRSENSTNRIPARPRCSYMFLHCSMPQYWSNEFRDFQPPNANFNFPAWKTFFGMSYPSLSFQFSDVAIFWKFHYVSFMFHSCWRSRFWFSG